MPIRIHILRSKGPSVARRGTPATVGAVTDARTNRSYVTIAAHIDQAVSGVVIFSRWTLNFHGNLRRGTYPDIAKSSPPGRRRPAAEAFDAGQGSGDPTD
jgi:hypothetical protein